ncbi:hypothetical protein KO317_02105 [Candidatus Micrarchaeota archaeon]|nr:hypothetical protein [Candidatus Micrarchaeota archaeon]
MAFDQAFITALQLSIVPLMIMVALTAISYLLSKLLNNKEFEIFARMELYQILVSIAILLFIIFGIQGLFEISTQLIGNDPFTISLEYLENLLVDTFGTMKSVFYGRVGMDILTKINIKIGLNDIPGVALIGIPIRADVTFPPFDLSTLTKALDKVFALMSPFYASLAIQQFALSIIKAIMIPFVLPIGIFLRIFPTTRNSGSFLIAVAIGFYIVFPFSYVIHAAIVENIVSDIQDNFMISITQIIFDEIPNSTTFDAFTGAWGKTFQVIEPKLYEIFNGFIMLSVVLMQGLFLPTISMAITVSFINSFQKFLIQRFD